MFRRFVPVLFSISALVAALLVPTPNEAAQAEPISDVVRTTGTEVIDVAAEVARTQYPSSQPVTFVVSATAYPDGMVAAARAAAIKAPIVLVGATSIPDAARSALEHLGSDRIVIVGGPAVVSPDVESQLKRYARKGVERVAGATRYQTAAELAGKYAAGVSRLYITGGKGYTDASTGGGLAGLHGAPMLLVRRNGLVAPTVAQLERLRPQEIIVLGGDATVSDAVVQQLRSHAASGQVTRVAGPDRYASAAKIAEQVPASDGMYVVNGTDYALGSVAAAVSGLTGDPVLLTKATSVPAVTASAIKSRKPSAIQALGTTEAISDQAIDALSSMLCGSAPETERSAATPPSDTLFGANASKQGQTLEQGVSAIDEVFGTVPVIRYFSSGLPFAWDSRPAELLDDRTLVVSFKENPRRIASGSLDTFFRDWFAAAPDDQTIYWSYFHEPENNIRAGEFTAAEYRAAWTRLGTLADEAGKPNMFSTLILTEWTMDPQSQRDYHVYDAGHDVVDVVAFDPYNGVWDPERDYYESPEVLLGHIVQAMEQDGRPWGIAEMGSRIVAGDDGSGRAEWLTDIGRYAESNNALFVTYFHTIGNADWRLRDRYSQKAWSELVSSSGGA